MNGGREKYGRLEGWWSTAFLPVLANQERSYGLRNDSTLGQHRRAQGGLILLALMPYIFTTSATFCAETAPSLAKCLARRQQRGSRRRQRRCCTRTL